MPYRRGADWIVEVLCSEGGGQVGGVGGDHDEGEQVPHASNEPRGERFGGNLAAHPHDGGPGPPQRVVDVEVLGHLRLPILNMNKK